MELLYRTDWRKTQWQNWRVLLLSSGKTFKLYNCKNIFKFKFAPIFLSIVVKTRLGVGTRRVIKLEQVLYLINTKRRAENWACFGPAPTFPLHINWNVFSVELVCKEELNLILVNQVKVRWVWAIRHWLFFIITYTGDHPSGHDLKDSF